MKKAEKRSKTGDKGGGVAGKVATDAADSNVGARMSRGKVAIRLNCSIRTVKRMEARGELHPIVVNRGGGPVHLFMTSEVEAIALERSPKPKGAGEVAALCFQLFDAGKDKREVVIIARQTPQTVNQLYEEWLMTLEESRLAKEQEKELKRSLDIAAKMNRTAEKELRQFEKRRVGSQYGQPGRKLKTVAEVTEEEKEEGSE